MTNYDLLYIILLLIFCIEIFKCCHNTIEGFSPAPTENRLSNSDDDSVSDKFATDGEEILIMTQEPNGIRKLEFSNIKTKLNKWVIVVVKSNKTGENVQISNFAPFQIKYLNYKTLNLLGQNNFLISNDSTVRYYLKFLNLDLLQNEIKKINEINAKKANYDLCLKINAGMPNQIARRCSMYT